MPTPLTGGVVDAPGPYPGGHGVPAPLETVAPAMRAAVAAAAAVVGDEGDDGEAGAVTPLADVAGAVALGGVGVSGGTDGAVGVAVVPGVDAVAGELAGADAGGTVPLVPATPVVAVRPAVLVTAGGPGWATPVSAPEVSGFAVRPLVSLSAVSGTQGDCIGIAGDAG